MKHRIIYADNKTYVTIYDNQGNEISTYIFKGELDFITLCEHVHALKKSEVKE